MYKAGLAKKDMTYFEPNIGLFGFGKFEHRATGIETSLHARALVIEDEQKNKTAIVVCEIGAIANSLKKEILKKLNAKGMFDFNDSNFLLSANHTHSAAGGFFHYPLYNFTSSGFHKGVLDKYAESTANSIIEANAKLVNSVLTIHKGSFNTDDKVCFNRSLKAYNANNDIDTIAIGKEHLATDREMILLKITDEQKNVIGCINWFGVHTTSCGSDLDKICADNKGYAASLHEEKYNNNFVSIFAQKPCGDITPLAQELWIENRSKKIKGTDYERAKQNGQLQCNKANELLNQQPNLELKGNLNSILSHYNFLNVIDVNNSHQITGEGALGLAFFNGTVDGKGMPSFLSPILTGLSNFASFIEKTRAKFTKKVEVKKHIHSKYAMHSSKKILLETTRKKTLGINSLNVLPAFADKIVEQMLKHNKNGSLANYPLTPHILPLQMISIGSLALISLPAEITIIAGKRLENELIKVLDRIGINQLIITPYCNEYSGYITTPEEYQLQSYEGGHTLFGEKTLNAYIQNFTELANEFLKKESERISSNIKPIEFDEETLNKRLYSLQKN